MGWGDCGKDRKGRPIGYLYEGTCDYPGCKEEVYRGLGNACGGMHGDCGGQACEGYFCAKHLTSVEKVEGFTSEITSEQLCKNCFDETAKLIGEYVLNGDCEVTWPK